MVWHNFEVERSFIHVSSHFELVDLFEPTKLSAKLMILSSSVAGGSYARDVFMWSTSLWRCLNFCTNPLGALNWGWSGWINSRALPFRTCVVIGSCLSCASRSKTNNCMLIFVYPICDRPSSSFPGSFLCFLSIIFYPSVYGCFWHIKMLACFRYRVLLGLNCYLLLLVNSVYLSDGSFSFLNVFSRLLLCLAWFAVTHTHIHCDRFQSQLGSAFMVSQDLTWASSMVVQ